MIPKIEIDNAIREVEKLGPFPYRSEEQVVLTRGVVRTLLAAAKVHQLTVNKNAVSGDRYRYYQPNDPTNMGVEEV